MQQARTMVPELGPRMSGTEAFALDHPREAAWIEANKDTFEFARDMEHDLRRWGRLTDRQLAAVQRCMDKSPKDRPSVAVTVARIEQAFASAKASGVQRPKLNLDTFQFKPAGKGSTNEGAIYVTEHGTYLGKITRGQFLRVRDCSQEQEGRIVAAASDPMAAAVAYGHRTGNCAVCCRPLSATGSVDVGIGPICRDRMGWFE